MTAQDIKNEMLDLITTFYMESHDCNGISLDSLAQQLKIERPSAETLVRELLVEDRVDLVFAGCDGNPHIRRLPAKIKKPTLELFENEELRKDLVCVYPSATHIDATQDLSEYEDRPYSKRLIAGGAQLDFCFFEMHVLERYFRDPRYRIQNGDFEGSINIADGHSKETPTRDRVSIERFALGWDESKRRAIVVILRDLVCLSPEHQRHWHGHERSGAHKINAQAGKAWLFGDWWTHRSVLSAIVEEMRVLNKFAAAAGDPPMFRKSFEERPNGFRLLLRPTSAEFEEFVNTLWKMTGENMNRAYFKERGPDHRIAPQKDGTIEKVRKGTLALLEDWLRAKVRFRPDEDPLDRIFGPLHQLRKLRQQPAHKITADEYDETYESRQDALLADVYDALRTLRLVMANHPAADRRDVPDWLFKGDIVLP